MKINEINLCNFYQDIITVLTIIVVIVKIYSIRYVPLSLQNDKYKIYIFLFFDNIIFFIITFVLVLSSLDCVQITTR